MDHAELRSEHEALLERALSNDADARRELVRTMAPVVHRRVAQIVLRKRGAAHGREVRQDIEDLVQEVFAACFDRRGRILRGWDRARGLSFENYVGLVAERQTLSILRTAKRSPWTEDPTLLAELESVEPLHIELAIESRNLLLTLADRMRERLSPLGMQYFRWLYIEQRGIQQVARDAGTSTGALYVWRTRLSRLLREIFDEIQAEVDAHE